MRRRGFLATCSLTMMGCDAPLPHDGQVGGFTGPEPAIGHLLRTSQSQPGRSATAMRRARVVIVGGGVAGLAAARALRLQGVHDVALLELAAQVGGNARDTVLAGLACPTGAHYLPVPSDGNPPLQDLLEELGLRRRVAGRWQWDERHLCHSPQERLYLHGTWQEGLLPMLDVSDATLTQYRRFAAQVQHLQRAAHWQNPVSGRPVQPQQMQLDALTMDAWLQRQGLDDPRLLWYLNYCSRDEYGCGLAEVSAWAAIHYFASRHGFRVPGEDGDDSEGLFTWPEGNAWLTRRMGQPLEQANQRYCNHLVTSVQEVRSGVRIEALNLVDNQPEAWHADVCIVATPIHVAARIVTDAPALLLQRAREQRSAAWVVANLHIGQPLDDPGGAAPSWDNVRYDTSSTASLGYVDATHQGLQSVPGATVLTWYQALGSGVAARTALLQQPWTHWRDAALADLAPVHPDLAGKLTRTAVTRHGHAMAVPVPGTLRALRAAHSAPVIGTKRLRFAHSDWAGYSVFEEAFALGHRAGATRLP